MPLSVEGLFFEDFSVGGEYSTRTKTIRQVDVAAFSELTMDRNPLHTDSAKMQNHPFGKPVVHGMLVASVGVGLISEMGLTRGTLVAMLEQKMVYKKPVYVGDTVHVKMEVIDKRETRDPMRGIVTYQYQVLNDSGVVAVEGTNTNMVFRKNARIQNEINNEIKMETKK